MPLGSGWTDFALAAFLLNHFVPTRPAIRARLVAALDHRLWFSLHGLVSLLVTAWAIRARAKPPIWSTGPSFPGPGGSRTSPCHSAPSSRAEMASLRRRLLALLLWAALLLVRPWAIGTPPLPL